MVKVVIDSLGTQLKITTFDMQVGAFLGGIYVQHMQYKGMYSLVDAYAWSNISDCSTYLQRSHDCICQKLLPCNCTNQNHTKEAENV